MGGKGPRVAIIGSGVSGLGMAYALKQARVDDFVVYEKGEDVGGTWRENRYPGLSCDVPSRFYQFSWAKNPDWSRLYAPGPEIHRYLRRVAADHGLLAHIRFGAEVTEATWRDGRWHLQTAAGDEDVVDVVVQATGVLHHPRIPDFPGRDTFDGPAFHSSRWDDSVPVAGRRVGLIGTGSTGAQITSALAGVASRLVVFQRSPDWVVTLPGWRYSARSRTLRRRLPWLRDLEYKLLRHLVADWFTKTGLAPDSRAYGVVEGLIRFNLRVAVRDPVLRGKLTPDWRPLCKRLIVAPKYYKAIQHPGVHLVTEGIQRIEPAGVRTADGVLHELDVLVFATGFDSHAYMRPMQITGVGGVTLDEAWADGPKAFKTVAMPGFPNMFTLQGPHSPVGNFSLVAIAEEQVRWVMGWIERIRAGSVASVMPTQEATDAYYADVRAALGGTIWAQGGCNSWYHGEDGAPILWPWSPSRFERVMRAEPDLREFEITRPAERTAAPA